MPNLSLHRPTGGFSKGTKQGLGVIAVLLTVLITIVASQRVEGGTAIAVTCDFIAASLLAVLVVWVVGGLFEIEGRLADIGIKGGGGAAIAFLVVFVLKPYSSLGPAPEFNVSIEYPPYEPLSFIIDQVDEERRAGKNAYSFEYNGRAEEIRKLRPVSPSLETVYNGNDWGEIFRKIDQDAACLSVEAKDAGVISLMIDLEDTSPYSRPNSASAAGLVCK